MTRENVDHVWREISRIETCMMATHDGTVLRARPMVGAADREAGTIWFITTRSDHSNQELERDPRVCLAYVDAATQTFVSVSGEASLSSDRRKIEDLWTPSVDACFDGGPEDPAALLIAVRPVLAEFWDDPHADLMAALDLLTAGHGDAEPPLADSCKVDM